MVDRKHKRYFVSEYAKAKGITESNAQKALKELNEAQTFYDSFCNNK